MTDAAWSCPYCFVTDPELRAVCAKCIERDAVQAQISDLTERVANLEGDDGRPGEATS